MKVSNTTIQNRSKQKRLASEHIVPVHHLDNSDVAKYLVKFDDLPFPKEELLYSLGVTLLGSNSNPAVAEFLQSYQYQIHDIPEPPVAFDLLGSLYQYLNSKHENLVKGSFYTGKLIAEDFVKDLDFSQGQTILDPACGSGVFLFRSDASAEQIHGVDFDPIAVMLAKFNYFLKFPDAKKPNIHHADFFEWYKVNSANRYDYVIGNPPYGANLDRSKIPTNHVVTGESFSYFVELGCSLIAETGLLRFLVPESLLNVKRHSDIRGFLLDFANLIRVKRYGSKFSGVMSDVYLIEVNRGNDKEVVFEADSLNHIPKFLFRELKNQIFVNLTDEDVSIIDKVASVSQLDLSESIFGLGVVTGDNKTKLLSNPLPNSEPIYSGKEVVKYRLLEPKNHLIFERANLQQVAPDAIYRAPQKLVYKVINKFLKFAVDETQALTTNSANIVIPKLDGYSIYSVMALLNSDLYSFLHLKLFGGVNKIAKENLMALPFPQLDGQQDAKLAALARQASDTGVDSELNDYVNHELFKLSSSEVAYLRLTLKN